MIILLNGVSSSGKSSIGEELKNQSENKLLHISIDDIFRLYSHHRITEIRNDKALFTNLLIEINKVLISFVKAIDEMGLNVVVDVVFEIPEILKIVIDELRNRNVYIVGIFCSLEVLENRESERTNRVHGLARSQIDVVHNGIVYDLIIDTTNMSIKEAADTIERRIIIQSMKTKAFEEMRKRISA
jgi:chloramphenicol 3-O phosphotransferase